MSQAPPARNLLIPGAVVAAAAALVYLNAFGHEFVYDDLPLVTWNARLSADDWLWQCASTSYWAEGNTGLYRPLTLVSLALNHGVSELNTWSYTLVNVLLHALSSALLAVLVRSLGGTLPAATAAGLVFAVHPVHTEAVTWTAGRAEVLCGALSLAALVCHWRGPTGWGWRVGAGLSLALALLSKEHALTLLGVVPCMDLLLRRGPWRGRLRPHLVPAYLPFLVLAAAYFGLRFAVLGDAALGPRFVVPLDNPLVPPITSALGSHYGATTGERLLSAVGLWGEHLRLLAWPAQLSADYSYAQWPVVRSPADGRFLVGLFALLATVYGAWALRRRAPLASWGLAFFLLTTSVTAQVLRPTGTVYAERLLYLPSVGFAVLLGVAFGRGWRGPRARVVACLLTGVLLVLGAARTVTRNPVWTNRRTLWEATVQTSPNSARAHSKLGITYLEAAEGLRRRPALRALHEQLLRAAVAHLERSLAIYPERADVNFGLVRAQLLRHDYQGAIAPLRRLERLPPSELPESLTWTPAVAGPPAALREVRAILGRLEGRRQAGAAGGSR